MKEFAASGFFVLRTPLLPLQDFLALSEGLGFFKTIDQTDDRPSAASADRKLIRARLQKLTDRPEVKEALWLASPEFFEALSLWRKDPESEKGQRLEHSLYRYVARMASRPTPFGLFAGCTLGTIGSGIALELGARSSYVRRSRLDMEYLCHLAEKISSDPEFNQRLPFRPNTSLYLAASQYHHSQGYLDHELRSYRLVGTDPAPYLEAALERAASAATPSDLASALIRDDPEISTAEAQQYIGQLIESQILVSDLNPPITGPEPLQDMLVHLGSLSDPSVKTALERISESLRKLDEGGIGNDLQGYQEIVRTVSALPVEFKLDHLIQVDMMKPAAHVSLDQRLVRSVLRAVEVLHSLTPLPREGPLEQFKKDFIERYQNQEIPLLLALDEDIGIGFETSQPPGSVPEPLIEGLDFPAPLSDISFKVTKAEFILMRKLQELAEEKKNTLELDAPLLELLQTEKPGPLPDAFAVLGSLIGPSGSPEKTSFCLQSAHGPSGALLLGRFCHADSGLAHWVQQHLTAEEAARASDNVVFAEIAHLPEGRVGNILYRPFLRQYEIPFLASSRAPTERLIAVTDLMVSVENDRILLRSRRLGCEVIPRLTSAHSYTHGRNLKLYKFLCCLQTQGVLSALAWDWGILDQALFLPRVVLNEVVMAPARWRLTGDMIKKYALEDPVESVRQIEKWRVKMRMPRFVLLAEADNHLLIDFENILSVETFVDYIGKRDHVILVEMLPQPERLCVHGPEGSFTSEVVIPFVRQQQTLPRDGVSTNSVKPTQPPSAVGRAFLPGSEWLFAKIYASPSQVDRLLLHHVAPLVGKIMASGDADGWFFIRYADPQWHLRLRFHGEAKRLSAQVLPQLWECLEQQREAGKAWRVQLDTYEREIERYGGPAGMQVAERLFQFDSELVLQLLAAIRDGLGDKARWRLAFCSVNILLAALGFDFPARHQLADNLRRSHEGAFALDHRYRKQLSARFRDERPVLAALLEPSPAPLTPAALPALQHFAGRVKQIHTELEWFRQRGELRKTKAELAASYVHMHLNRLFRSAANAQEMVLYDFLARACESKLRREDKR